MAQVVIHSRQSQDAIHVEDSGSDEFDEGSEETDFEEIVGGQFVPCRPPMPCSFWVFRIRTSLHETMFAALMVATIALFPCVLERSTV